MRRRNEQSVLLVDLDGTLTDPAEGIVRSFRFALEALGQTPPPAAELTWIIGPPLRRSFAEMLGGTGDPEEALTVYRGRYSTEGLFEAVVYDGVRETLTDQGFHMIACDLTIGKRPGDRFPEIIDSDIAFVFESAIRWKHDICGVDNIAGDTIQSGFNNIFQLTDIARK